VLKLKTLKEGKPELTAHPPDQRTYAAWAKLPVIIIIIIEVIKLIINPQRWGGGERYCNI